MDIVMEQNDFGLAFLHILVVFSLILYLNIDVNIFIDILLI